MIPFFFFRCCSWFLFPLALPLRLGRARDNREQQADVFRFNRVRLFTTSTVGQLRLFGLHVAFTALPCSPCFVATWQLTAHHVPTVSLVDEIPFYPGTVVGYGHLWATALLLGDWLINSASAFFLLDQGPWA